MKQKLLMLTKLPKMAYIIGGVALTAGIATGVMVALNNDKKPANEVQEKTQEIQELREEDLLVTELKLKDYEIDTTVTEESINNIEWKEFVENIDEVKEKEYELYNGMDFELVEFGKIGEYVYSLNFNNKTYEGKLIIKEKVEETEDKKEENKQQSTSKPSTNKTQNTTKPTNSKTETSTDVEIKVEEPKQSNSQYVPVGVTSSLKGWTATTLEGNKVSVTCKGHTNIGTLVRDGVEGHYTYNVDFGTGSVNVGQRLFYTESPTKYLLSLNSEGKVFSAAITMDKIGQYITVSNTLSCTESEAKNTYNPSCANKYGTWYVGYLNSHPGHTLYKGYVYDTNFRNIGLYVYEGIPKSEEEHQAEEAKNNGYCRQCEEGFNYKQFFLN